MKVSTVIKAYLGDQEALAKIETEEKKVAALKGISESVHSKKT